jgi:hypothetical protein
MLPPVQPIAWRSQLSLVPLIISVIQFSELSTLPSLVQAQFDLIVASSLFKVQIYRVLMLLPIKARLHHMMVLVLVIMYLDPPIAWTFILKAQLHRLTT